MPCHTCRNFLCGAVTAHGCTSSTHAACHQAAEKEQKKDLRRRRIAFAGPPAKGDSCSTLRQATMIRIVALRRVSLVPGEPSSTHGSSSSVRTKAIPEQISNTAADKDTAKADEACNTASHCRLALRLFTISCSYIIISIFLVQRSSHAHHLNARPSIQGAPTQASVPHHEDLQDIAHYTRHGYIHKPR